MKHRLNIKSLVIGGIIGGLLTTGVGYAASQLTSIEVSMNPAIFMHNGKQLELKDGQQSFIYDGTTYVPLRWLGESLGKTVEWNDSGRTISITDPVIEEEDPDNKLEDKQDNEVAELDAKLTLDKGEYTVSDTLQLTIKNEGSSTISFGRPYSLEYLKDEEWVDFPMDGLFFTMELIILAGNDTFTQNIDLSQLGLKEGTYRIIKSIYNEEYQTPVDLQAEFEVKAK